MNKTCTTCLTEKPEEDFYWQIKNVRRKAACKACSNKRTSAHICKKYQEDPEFKVAQDSRSTVYRNKNRGTFNKRGKKHNKRQRKEVSPSYAKELLMGKGSKIKVPEGLIEAKKQHLLTKRMIKENEKH